VSSTRSITLEDALDARLQRSAEATGLDVDDLVRDAIERWLDDGGAARLLNQLVLDMNVALVEAKKPVAAAIADLKALARAAEQERTFASEWEARGAIARQTEREALAEEADARAAEHRARAEGYDREHVEHGAVVDSLKASLQALAEKVERAKHLKARALRRLAKDEAHAALAALHEMGAKIERLVGAFAATEVEGD
jgi:phage shock protein A